MNKVFNFKEAAKLFNNIKHARTMNISLSFTKEDILDWFKECGLPMNQYFWMEFRDYGILIQLDRNKYVFANKNPIFWEVFKQIHEIASIRVKKVRGLLPEISKPVSTPSITVEDAIKLLKSKGYIIYKEV